LEKGVAKKKKVGGEKQGTERWYCRFARRSGTNLAETNRGTRKEKIKGGDAHRRELLGLLLRWEQQSKSLEEGG